MPKPFINFRTEDTGDNAFRLAADLRRVFGEDQIFIDRAERGGIPYGASLPDALTRELAQCTVFVSLIGENWLLVQNKTSGERRLSEEYDWVRKEIEIALARLKKGEIEFVPVMVDRDKLPDAALLPRSIRKLTDHRAMTLRGELPDWDTDVARLVRALESRGFHRRDTSPEPDRAPGSLVVDAPPVVPAAYREWLRRQCSSIELLGMKVKKGPRCVSRTSTCR